MKYQTTISKEDVNKLPIEEFHGNVHIIDHKDNIALAMKKLNRCKVVGFDTETRPSFKKGVTYCVSLLQLATDKEVFLFRLNKIGFHAEVMELLNNPNILKIGLSVKDDLHVLNKKAAVKGNSFIELQTYVKQFDIEDNSLQRIYAIVCGKKISKSQRLSNWEVEELTPQQVRYAALDAKSCLDIWKILEKKRKRKESYKREKQQKEQLVNNKNTK